MRFAEYVSTVIMGLNQIDASILSEKGSVFVKRIEKYELMYINFTWAFVCIMAVHVAVMDFMYNESANGQYFSSVFKFVILLVVALLNLTKLGIIRYSSFSDKRYYYSIRLIEILVINVVIIFMGLGDRAYALHIFLILVTCLCVGRKPALMLIGYAFLLNLIMQTVFEYVHNNTLIIDGILLQKFLEILFVYTLLFLFALLCGKIYNDTIQNGIQNKKLYAELGNKYDQLAVAQEEIKVQNEKLRDANSQMENTNKKLRESLAELFTVQQITQAISSIFDIKELLRHVNDIIIGVMGVSNSTIVLYDESKERLKVHTTNITNKSDLIHLNDNINCDILLGVIENGEPVLENFVDKNEYPFIQEREVNSLICVPLITKSKKYGLVLIEHKYHNAFDDDNLRLLNIIGNQVGIVLENVQLYQKLHELATVDGLTGIYNRLYFQERLSKEFEIATKEQYDLSLAIFDIDHFKRFNDTFGHLFGDKVLRHIAQMIKNSLRNGDILARFGGEEFVILLPRTSAKEAYEKVERLREMISKSFIKDELVTASVTVSFGLSSYPEVADTESELLKTADNALYDAKESGRNCVRIAH